MSNHLLQSKEIMSIPAGRIMNTFVQEYVLRDYPTRWSNSQQTELGAHWFEEHPRSCAEDDGGYCSADGLAKYSTDTSMALSLAETPALKQLSLSTKKVGDVHWATFSDVPFADKSNWQTGGWARVWAEGDTLALAICRAALLAV